MVRRVTRPDPGEYAPYFDRYVSLVHEDQILSLLNAQASTVHDALSGLSDERAAWRYAPDKWSVREVAHALGVNAGRVYLAKHRVGARLKKEMRAQEAALL